MTTIRNTTPTPLRVPLPGGKLLHLGPGHTAHVPDGAERLRSFQSMLEDGRLVVVAEGDRDGAGGREDSPHSVSVHGHAHARRPLVTGDR